MKILGYILLGLLICGMYVARTSPTYEDKLTSHGIPCRKVTTLELGANGSAFVACDGQTKGYTILNDGRVL